MQAGGRVDQARRLLFWGGSKYDGQRDDKFCYNINIGSGTLCCDGSYDIENGGFKKGAVCYLEESFSCKDLQAAVFVRDGEITMDTLMVGMRVFPTIVTGSGFLIKGDPSQGMVSAPFEYSIRYGIQNGLKTTFTSKDSLVLASPMLARKKFLVSGWDENQEPSDHEIEWAGPTTHGLGGESFHSPVVLMKGSRGAMIYLDDQDGVLYGSGYRTPVIPENGISDKTKAVEFCFDYRPPAAASGFRDADEGDAPELEKPPATDA
jgi:hypothetical protein